MLASTTVDEMCPFDIDPTQWTYEADENGNGVDSGSFLEFNCIRHRRKRFLPYVEVPSVDGLWDDVLALSEFL